MRRESLTVEKRVKRITRAQVGQPHARRVELPKIHRPAKHKQRWEDIDA